MGGGFLLVSDSPNLSHVSQTRPLCCSYLHGCVFLYELHWNAMRFCLKKWEKTCMMRVGRRSDGTLQSRQFCGDFRHRGLRLALLEQPESGQLAHYYLGHKLTVDLRVFHFLCCPSGQNSFSL